jgi:hypothetical protein
VTRQLDLPDDAHSNKQIHPHPLNPQSHRHAASSHGITPQVRERAAHGWPRERSRRLAVQHRGRVPDWRREVMARTPARAQREEIQEVTTVEHPAVIEVDARHHAAAHHRRPARPQRDEGARPGPVAAARRHDGRGAAVPAEAHPVRV